MMKQEAEDMEVEGGGERRANNRWKINADWRQMVINQRTNKEQTGAGEREIASGIGWGPQRLMKNDKNKKKNKK